MNLTFNLCRDLICYWLLLLNNNDFRWGICAIWVLALDDLFYDFLLDYLFLCHFLCYLLYPIKVVSAVGLLLLRLLIEVYWNRDCFHDVTSIETLRDSLCSIGCRVEGLMKRWSILSETLRLLKARSKVVWMMIIAKFRIIE